LAKYVFVKNFTASGHYIKKLNFHPGIVERSLHLHRACEIHENRKTVYGILEKSLLRLLDTFSFLQSASNSMHNFIFQMIQGDTFGTL